MSAAAQSLGTDPGIEPFRDEVARRRVGVDFELDVGKSRQKARPDASNHRCAGEIGHIKAQAPKGMPLLAFEVVQRPRDLLDRRPSPVEQAETASVSETLCVVRFTNRTARRSSSCRIVWLSADGVTPMRDAAARRLRLSATATNAARSARSVWRIAEFLSAPNATNIGLDLDH
jgi:hypothetical protein